MVRPLKLKFNDARNHAFQRIHPNDVSNIIKRQTEHGSYQYRYDHLDRLSQAEIARYSYDPFGRRIRKTVSQSGGQNGTSTPLGTITYLYADEDLLAEADISGNITTTYGWLPNGIWGTAPQWKADVTLGSGSGTPATLTYHYFHNDHLGSSQRLTNDQGVLTWSARMEAFGKTTTIDSIITNLVNGQSQTAVMPTTTVNNLRSPGQFEDGETNTHYNYFRDYQPCTGRYSQSDPIGLLAGMNRYGYVDADPLQLLDSLGLAPRAAKPPKPSCTSLYNIPAMPESVNIFDNMDRARGMGSPEFIRLVENKGEWDYKRQGKQYEEFGNYNFGATAWAMGFPDQVAERGAGWYQQNRGAGGGTGNWWGASSPYGDQVQDNVNIRAGQALALAYFSGRCTR